MRSILHTMHYEVPFDVQRVGGFRNMIFPLADSGTLSPFCLPAVPTGFSPSLQYLTRVNERGIVQERYEVTHAGFLTVETIGDYNVGYNLQTVDLLTYLSELSTPIIPPCGLYFFECYFYSKGNPAPENYHYKTEIFMIDEMRVATIRQPDGGRGDFDPGDFNDDFFITN